MQMRIDLEKGTLETSDGILDRNVNLQSFASSALGSKATKGTSNGPWQLYHFDESGMCCAVLFKNQKIRHISFAIDKSVSALPSEEERKIVSERLGFEVNRERMKFRWGVAESVLNFKTGDWIGVLTFKTSFWPFS
jgi:hypothetical protein